MTVVGNIHSNIKSVLNSVRKRLPYSFQLIIHRMGWLGFAELPMFPLSLYIIIDQALVMNKYVVYMVKHCNPTSSSPTMRPIFSPNLNTPSVQPTSYPTFVNHCHEYNFEYFMGLFSLIVAGWALLAHFIKILHLFSSVPTYSKVKIIAGFFPLDFCRFLLTIFICFVYVATDITSGMAMSWIIKTISLCYSIPIGYMVSLYNKNFSLCCYYSPACVMPGGWGYQHCIKNIIEWKDGLDNDGNNTDNISTGIKIEANSNDCNIAMTSTTINVLFNGENN